MTEESPAIPGFEGFVPRLRTPVPSNYPGELFQLSTERDIFMGIISLSGAPSSLIDAELLPNLTPEQQVWEEAQGLTTARRLMRQYGGVFWGCPEGTFSLLVSEERHPDFDTYPRKFSARFNSKGKVCITRSGNLGLARTYPETFSHPVKGSLAPNSYDDTVFNVPEANYVVTVTQMFSWRDSQFAEVAAGHIHYHIHLRPLSEHKGSLNTEIPWIRVAIPT